MKHSITCDIIPDNKYVYIFKCENYYKIGITNNVKRRLHDAQVSTPFKIELIYNHLCKFASQREYDLHWKFRKQNVRGEWFNLTEDNINFIKQELEKRGN